jgi:poly(A) polymerase
MNEYEHFLVVISSAISHIQWFGLIESKLKYFIASVEKEPSLESARIWPKPLTKRAEKSNAMTQLWFIGLVFNRAEVINISG